MDQQNVVLICRRSLCRFNNMGSIRTPLGSVISGLYKQVVLCKGGL